MPGWWCRPTSSLAGAVLLYLHRGGYAQGKAASFRGLAGHFAQQAGTDALIPDYRLAPEHPFPAAFEDVSGAYRALAEGQADHITVAGDSAGGGLALALLSLLATDASLAQPRGAAVLSPLADLAVTGGSVEIRAEADPLFTRDAITALAAQYLQEQDPANPQASPLYARLAGLPPICIDIGDDEILLDDSRRHAECPRSGRRRRHTRDLGGNASCVSGSSGQAPCGRCLDRRGRALPGEVLGRRRLTAHVPVSLAPE